jgi:hypothetical protein
LTRAWATHVPDSSLGFRVVSLLDYDDFQDFDCIGAEPTPSAEEINSIIRKAEWSQWDGHYLCLQFGDKDTVIAYAVLAFGDFFHPCHSDVEEQPYLEFALLGIQHDRQHGTDPGSSQGERYGDVILRAVETLVAPQHADVFGIYAFVRVANGAALRLLERNGYARDPEAFRDASSGADSEVLRKLRAAWRRP